MLDDEDTHSKPGAQRDGDKPEDQTVDQPSPDPSLARAFLGMLDPDCEVWELRTFDDDPARKDPELTCSRRGRLDQVLLVLERMNEMGAGVFVTVHDCDGRGRSAHNVTRVRALFADTDGANIVPLLALKPTSSSAFVGASRS